MTTRLIKTTTPPHGAFLVHILTEQPPESYLAFFRGACQLKRVFLLREFQVINWQDKRIREYLYAHQC